MKSTKAPIDDDVLVVGSFVTMTWDINTATHTATPFSVSVVFPGIVEAIDPGANSASHTVKLFYPSGRTEKFRPINANSLTKITKAQFDDLTRDFDK